MMSREDIPSVVEENEKELDLSPIDQISYKKKNLVSSKFSYSESETPV